MATGNEYDDLLATETGEAKTGNPYHDILVEDKSSQKSAVQQSLYVAAAANPDQKARVLELSKKTNLPPNIVERNFDQIAKKNTVESQDYDSLIDNNPGLSKWLENPDNAALAHDDIDNLKGIESTIKDYSLSSALSDSLMKGLNQAASSTAKIPGFIMDQVIKKKTFGLFGGSDVGIDQAVPNYFQKKADAYKVPDLETSIIGSIKDGNYAAAGRGMAAQFVSNAPNQAAILAAGFFGGPSAGLMLAGGSSTAQKFSETTAQKPLEPGQEPGLGGTGAEKKNALPNALITGGIEAGFESLGTFGILKSWEKQIAKQAGKQASIQAVKEFSKEFVASVAGEANEEFWTSVAQDLTDYITDVNPDALKGIGERAVNAGIVGGVSGGAMTAPAGAFMGFDHAAKARQTTIAKQFYESLGSTLEATKLRKRLPDAQRALVEEITKNSPVENIYISTDAIEKYFQSQNEVPAKIMQDLGVSEAYNEAKETGSDIKIPLATWTKAFIETDHYKGLANDVKFNQDQLSVNELNVQTEQTKKDLEKAAANPDVPLMDEFSQSGKLVQQNVAEQLKAINQDPKQAVLYRGFEVIGKRAGIDPLELYNKYALRIGTGQGSVIEENGPDVFDLAIEEYKKQQPTGEVSPEERAMFEQAKNEAKSQVKEMAKRAFAALPDVSTDAVAEALGLPKNEVRFLTKGMKRSGKTATGTYSAEEILNAAKSGEGQSFNQSSNVLNQTPQQNIAAPFYSRLIKTVEDKMGGSASVEQINGMLKEIKPEERKWMGLDEFLKGKTKVSKEELLANLRGNQVKIEEVTKNELIFADPELQNDPNTQEVKYSKHTLPGGKNYREVLFTMPPKTEFVKLDPLENWDHRVLEGGREVWRRDINGVSAVILIQSKGTIQEGPKGSQFPFAVIVDGKPARSFKTKAQAENFIDTSGKFKLQAFGTNFSHSGEFDSFEQAAKEVTDRVSEIATASKEGNYKSSHFDEANILAHTRLNDRTDSEGKKVLFVEEIQSDWHQEGRKKGYKGDQKPDAPSPQLIPEMTESDVIAVEGPFSWTVRASNRDNQFYEKETTVGKGVVGSEKEAKEYALKMYNETIEKQNDRIQTDFRIQNLDRSVPDAPFKKTWHEFVLKRLIREAAEKGYDKIAWTTGEQQSERYDLSKQVDSVESVKVGDGKYNVFAKKDGRTVSEKRGASEAELPSLFGKDLAEKIVKDSASNEENSYSGVDLKVGGEGMKGFYDKILPEFANKFGKKYGAKVVDGAITAPKTAGQYYADKNADGKFAVFFADPNNPGSLPQEISKHRTKAIAREEASLLNAVLDQQAKQKVHTMEITPELKAAALNEGFSLFQKDGDQTPRGQLTIGKDRQFNIDILKNADRSTFLHETGHFYLEVLGDTVDQLKGLETKTEQQQKLIDDYNEILKWFGVESRADVKVDQHEQFARGFEAYLMEGKAPTQQLRSIFARFKVWLTSIYRQVKNLNVELTPEVRGVLDRMLATDEEISQAQRELNAQPLFKDPAASGMSKEMAKKYEAARDAARREAEETLTSKVLKEMERTKQKEYKARESAIREEVSKNLSAGPVYRAIDMLKAGSPLPDGTPLKISRSSVVSSYGEDFLKRLPKNITSDTGIHFEMVAESFGFESGDQFLVQLANAPDKQQLIDQTTASRMDQEYPEIYKDGPQFHDEAVKAYHNENRSKMLRMELEHIASNNMPVLKEAIRRVAKRVPTEKMVREQARGIIGQKNVNEIKPYTFQRAEAKAAKEAGELLAKGDFDGAFEAKRRELLNHELYKAAQEAIDSVESGLEKFKKIIKTSDDESLAKKRDMDMVNAARAILTQFGLGKSDRTAQSYIEPIKQYDPDTYGVVQSLIETATERVGPYDQVPYNDFQAMQDSVLAIWDMAKSAKEIVIDGQVMNREEVMGQLSTRLEELSPKEKRAGYDRAVNTWDKVQMGLLGIRSALRRVESWADAVDGDQGEKLFRKFIWNPISDATTQYRLQKKDVLQKYLEIVKKIEGGLTFKEINAPELGYRFKDKTELLGAMLHMGNESNLSKLLRGRGWGDYNEAGELDTSRWNQFLDRMVREGTLTKEDFDYAQGVWDLLEEIKPMAQKAHKQMYGHYFNEITANEFSTPFGVYRGGYVPAIADPFIAVDAAIRNEKEMLEKSNNSFMFPTAGRGFTKSRVNAYAAPLEMNVASIPRHIDKVMRFAIIEPHVKEVGRIIMNKDFRTKLNHFDPSVGGDMLVPWLQRAAQQKIAASSTGFAGRAADTIFRELRTRTGFSTMVFNVVNTLQQFTGLSITAVKVKPKYIRNALWNYTRGPTAHAEMIAEKSDFMKTKLTGQAQEIQSSIDDMLLNPSKYDQLRDFANKHGYFMQGGTQNIVDSVSWAAAYDQAIENGLAEKDAVREADSVIRQTQGSFAAEDISRFETGTPFVRAFTMFYSYFNMQANLMGTEFTKVARDMGLRKGAGRALYIYTMGFMIPAFLSELLVMSMSGKGLDENDDDQYLDDLMRAFFGSQFRSATAMIPVAGSTLNAAVNSFNDKPYDDRISTSPAVAAIESAVAAPNSVYKAIAEHGSRKKAIRDTLTATSLLTGIPVAPLARPLGYLSDLEEGKAQPTGPIDLTRGLITGKSGEKK